MPIIIRPVESDDYTQWLPLWAENNLGRADHAVTEATWVRLNDPSSGVHGLGVFENAAMAGFVHFITHPVTGHLRPACYMQDLFVAPAHRKKGLGRALVTALAQHAGDQQYARLYWLAEAKNEAAQKLYDGIGLKLDFTFHVMPL